MRCYNCDKLQDRIDALEIVYKDKIEETNSLELELQEKLIEMRDMSEISGNHIAELERKDKMLEKCKQGLEFYGNQHLYDREKYLVMNKDFAKDDLEETGYSRFTPGKLAREILAELETNHE